MFPLVSLHPQAKHQDDDNGEKRAQPQPTQPQRLLRKAKSSAVVESLAGIVRDPFGSVVGGVLGGLGQWPGATREDEDAKRRTEADQDARKEVLYLKLKEVRLPRLLCLMVQGHRLTW
jgi:hypothetical protein